MTLSQLKWMALQLLIGGLFFADPFCSAGDNQAENNETIVKVIVTDSRFQQHIGMLKSLTEQELGIESGGHQSFTIEDVFKVEFQNQSSRPRIVSSIQLVNGDRLTGYPASMDDERLTVVWASNRNWPNWSIPLENIRSFVLTFPGTRSARNQLWTQLNSWETDADLVVLKNGDQIQGVLDHMDRSTVFVEKTEVLLSGVQAVVINPNLLSDLPAPEKHAVVSLRNGSQVTVYLPLIVQENQLTLRAIWDQSISVSLTDVDSIRFLGPQLFNVSSLQPTNYEFTPYLAQQWNWSRGQNVNGGPLTIAGQQYALGFGMHSQSRLTFDLKGKFTSFQTLVGIDSSAGSNGDAVVWVETDGIAQSEKVEIAAGGSPVQIGPIDVRQKEKLTFVVDFGKNGDIGDQVNWCDPLLFLAEPDTMN